MLHATTCRGAFCRARPADFQGAYGEAATGATMTTSDHNRGHRRASDHGYTHNASRYH